MAPSPPSGIISSYQRANALTERPEEGSKTGPAPMRTNPTRPRTLKKMKTDVYRSAYLTKRGSYSVDREGVAFDAKIASGGGSRKKEIKFKGGAVFAAPPLNFLPRANNKSTDSPSCKVPSVGAWGFGFRKEALRKQKGGDKRKPGLATPYSPTGSRPQYHRRWQA